MMRYTYDDSTVEEYVLRNLASASWRSIGQRIFLSEARTKAFIRANREKIRMYAHDERIFSNPAFLPDDILYRLKRLDAKVAAIQTEMLRLIYLDSFGGLSRQGRQRRSNATKKRKRTRTPKMKSVCRRHRTRTRTRSRKHA
jgi:hypothetical protein